MFLDFDPCRTFEKASIDDFQMLVQIYTTSAFQVVTMGFSFLLLDKHSDRTRWQPREREKPILFTTYAKYNKRITREMLCNREFIYYNLLVAKTIQSD